MKALLILVFLVGAVSKDWYAEEEQVSAEETKVKEPAKPCVQCVLLCLPGCGPCEVLKRNVRAELVPLGWKVGEDLQADVRVVDVSCEEAMQERFRATAFPTSVVLCDGKEVWRRVGVVSMGELTAVMNRHRQIRKSGKEDER